MSSAGELRICGPEEIVRSAGVFTQNAFDSVCIPPFAADERHTFEVIACPNPLLQPRVPKVWFHDHQREAQLQSIPWGIAWCREEAYGVHVGTSTSGFGQNLQAMRRHNNNMIVPPLGKGLQYIRM